jgi:hypothetical protein
MDLPAFFADAPTVTLHDPLARFLGAEPNGLMTYGYGDAVKLAGHSCPTVAGAYLMVRRGLARLYGADMPERGAIEAYLSGARDEGTTGVIASVVTLITGAAPETGFGGIGASGRFGRRNLLHFEAPIDALLALRRRDNGRGVLLDLDTSAAPPDPALGPLFSRAVAGIADAVEQARFAALWQDRVALMLLTEGIDCVSAAEWRATA